MPEIILTEPTVFGLLRHPAPDMPTPRRLPDGSGYAVDFSQETLNVLDAGGFEGESYDDIIFRHVFFNLDKRSPS